MNKPAKEKPVILKKIGTHIQGALQRADVGVRSSPVRLLSMITISIFLCEFAVMSLISYLPLHRFWVVALFGSILLVLLLAPILYVFLFRPLVLYFAENLQATEALRKSEELYRALFHNAGEAIYVAQDGKIIFANPKTSALYGYTHSELTSKPFTDFIHAEDRSIVLDRHRRRMKGDVLTSTYSFRIVNKTGDTRWVEITAVPFTWQERPATLCFQLDITERKHSVEELRISEERYRTILENIEDGYFEVDLTGRYIFSNDALCKIRGYSRDELMGLDNRDYMDPETAKTIYGQFNKVYRTGVSLKGIEYETRRKDGTKSYVESSVSLISDSRGQPTGFRGIVRDISNRKEAEEEMKNVNMQLKEAIKRANDMAVQAEIASAAKSEFLANMSHEIRTPMNGVIGMTGLLLDTELSIDQRRYAETIDASANSLLSLINDILDFSKMDAKQLDLEILDFDLQSLLEDFAATLAFQAHKKGLELVCSMSSEVPSLLRGDPGRLRQILTNLTGNAIKFTQGGEVAIHVTLELDTGVTARLRFSVRDTGIGIPEDKVGLLFDAFQQVDASTTRQYGGTGLGLSICKQLAEIMGGGIGVESIEGEGSEFWFTACLDKQSEGRTTRTSPPANLRGVRVLIVDDNVTNREILTTQMTSWKMDVSEAEDGPAALQALYKALDEETPFQIAVIDMQMPGMDGESLGRAIKAENRLAGTRLVLLTSLGIRGDAKRLAEIGFDAYMPKPARALELRGLLSNALAKREGGTMKPFTMATRHTARETLNLFAGSKARILLAEDNVTNQQVALGLLKKLGLAAEAVANGQEALKALADIPYDLVLMDLQMPEMDGLEATRHIRNLQSAVRNHDVPIIAMTAHAMAGDREKCLNAGMNGYVSKPVDPLSLAKELEKWLAKREDDENSPKQPFEPAAGEPVGTPKTDGRKLAEVEKPNHESERTDRAIPIFDRKAFLDRLLGDEDLAATVIAGFLDDMPGQLSAIKEFMEQHQVDKVRAQAHKIKGAAGNVTGQAFQETAAAMEQAANAGDLEALAGLMPELESRFIQLKKAMESKG